MYTPCATPSHSFWAACPLLTDSLKAQDFGPTSDLHLKYTGSVKGARKECSGVTDWSWGSEWNFRLFHQALNCVATHLGAKLTSWYLNWNLHAFRYVINFLERLTYTQRVSPHKRVSPSITDEKARKSQLYWRKGAWVLGHYFLPLLFDNLWTFSKLI